MKKLILLASFGFLLNGFLAVPWAIAEIEDQEEFTIDEVSVKKIESPEIYVGNLETGHYDQVSDLFYEGQKSQTEKTGPKAQADIGIDQIINIGKKVWDIVEKNRPVTNVELNEANALPKGVQSWLDLEGWSIPKSEVYEVTFKNLYKITVAKFAFRVVYTTQGSIGGVGQYVARVAAIPANLDIMWGIKFNASVKVPTVVNVGTRSQPIAGIELEVHWSIDTIVKHIRSSESFFVKGDGVLLHLTTGR